jgi:cytochrome c oxidase subunit 2
MLSLFAAGAASAALPGQPSPGSLGFQPAVTPIMERITSFNNALLIIVTIITLVVVGLLLYVMVRYRAKANPEPAKWSHNTLVEVIWTGIPVLILLGIAVPSFALLYFDERVPDGTGEIPAPAFTIKATGYQWAWGYEYPDQGVSEYRSNMIPDADIGEGQVRNLSVDNPIVIPVNTTVRLQVTAGDVIHNWAMPSFGTKVDAIPGRLNESWFHVYEEGTYYGQCSELCGTAHAFMPIEVRVVDQATFDAFIAAGPGSPEANELVYAYQAARETRLAQLD